VASPVRVIIAVLTYRRPAQLESLLPLLIRQIERLDGELSDCHVEVLVIDNDPDLSARSSVLSLNDPRVGYAAEPRPGIACARNRALDESAEADLLIFIDDDERPSERWLSLLLRQQADTGAAAVVGAVVSEFDGTVAPWLVAGGFFLRRRLRTGTRVDVAATNNLLLDLRTVRSLALRFDPAFGLSGGEDTLFTRTLAANGGRMVWCDEAVVTDQVPAARMTRRWVLLRALSSGNTVARVGLRLASGPVGRLRIRAGCVGAGLARVLGGTARAVVGTVLRSAAHQARGARTAARGWGMVTGAAGWVYQEYRRT
jgi:succinoglycan biosynthesis protein ExoM